MRIVPWLLDAVFPPRPDELRLREIHVLPYVLQMHSDTICLSRFSERNIATAITENKYHHNQHACRLLATLLSRWLKECSETVLLVPIPLSRERQRERGYNQVAEVLRQLPSQYQSCIKTNLLARQKDTRPQTSLKKTERKTNVAGAFAAAKPARLRALGSKTLILVDDVLTTGATLEAAHAALQPHLPADTKCLKLALAH